MRRAWPVLAMAAVAFAIGAIVGGTGGSDARTSLAERFVAAWTRSDYAARIKTTGGCSYSSRLGGR